MPTCLGCGASYDDRFAFCPYCGRAKPQPHTVRVQVAEPIRVLVEEQQPKNACPLCGRVDQVRRVSAIHTAETSRSETTGHNLSTGSGSGSADFRTGKGKKVGRVTSSSKESAVTVTTMSSVLQSDLAKALAPPQRPVDPRTRRNGGGCALALILTLLAVGLASAPVVVAASVGGAQQAPVDAGPALIVLGLLVTAAILLVIVLSRVEIKGVGSTDGSQGGAQPPSATKPPKMGKRQREAAGYAQELAEWERAMQRWNALYYCYRDDVVFGLEPGRYARPAETVRFCYWKP